MNRTILRTITLISLAATAGCASAPLAVQQQPDFARFRGAIAVEEIVLAPTVAAELPENDRNVLASKLRIALVSSLSGTATVRGPGPGAGCGAGAAGQADPGSRVAARRAADL